MACSKTGARVADYTAAPVYFSESQNGAHEWLIEFVNKPENLEAFTMELDKALQGLNGDYEAKRQSDLALRMPKVHAVPEGFFSRWLDGKGKAGGQHKVPRLSNERKTMDEMLRILYP